MGILIRPRMRRRSWRSTTRPYERLLRAPQVQESRFTLRVNFVLRAAQRYKPLTIFAHLSCPHRA